MTVGSVSHTICAMTPIEALVPAVQQVQSFLNQIQSNQWDNPTPCAEWNVRGLAEHLVGGSRMSTTLLNGGSSDEAKACFVGNVLSEDPAVDFAAAAEIEVRTISAANLDTLVNHPAMQMPAAQLLNFRISDYLVHSWDLARGLGVDDSLNPVLVEHVWESIQPMAPMIPHVGVFGAGPSGAVSADAPLQVRLLDLLGRRP
jgi:uncharacterized protein (TIGR03086 family)